MMRGIHQRRASGSAALIIMIYCKHGARIVNSDLRRIGMGSGIAAGGP